MPKPATQTKTQLADSRFVVIIAKKPGICTECATPVERGDKIVWDKHYHCLYCYGVNGCGEEMKA